MITAISFFSTLRYILLNIFTTPFLRFLDVARNDGIIEWGVRSEEHEASLSEECNVKREKWRVVDKLIRVLGWCVISTEVRIHGAEKSQKRGNSLLKHTAFMRWIFLYNHILFVIVNATYPIIKIPPRWSEWRCRFRLVRS